MEPCLTLIVAAGRGTRLTGDVPKQYRTLAGEPVLRRTVRAVVAAGTGVRVVIHPDDRAFYDEAVAGLGLAAPVNGGATRQDSVLKGLESIAANASDRPPGRVLIHDAARPFVSAGAIRRVREALAAGWAGAIAALPVVDTLKRSIDDEGGMIADTVGRQRLWRAQTPQGFQFGDILIAHRALAGRNLTDDAAVAEQAGMAVTLVAGDEDNMKITTEADWSRAERMAAEATETRSGIGFDVHRFGPGDYVTLCGVRVPHDRALLGHSDADVGLHALTDALLGAIAAGDIGHHFPPSDDRWKGASSDRFLRRAGELISERGGMIVNVDVTIIGERPRIGPHREAMRAAVAGILGIAAGRVSVKATTTERLGFTGRAEGLAAQAAATVRLPPPESAL
jgi:2-C-methyl-D-erythritol 4-phosphate cytidylyltransferase / 2-C-methyl-D-erythritol 2,4-cyclodiphosphate synthase